MNGKGKAENIRVCARFWPRNEREKAQSRDKTLRYDVERGNTSVTFHGVGPNVTQTNRSGVREEKTNFKPKDPDMVALLQLNGDPSRPLYLAAVEDTVTITMKGIASGMQNTG